MELEKAVTFVNAATSAQVGRTLSEVEIALLQGAWESETYEQIADRSGYSIGYLQNDIGPKFWKLLSNIFDRKLSKTNVRGVLSQFTPTSVADSTSISPPVQTAKSTPITPTTVINWGEAPDVSTFYGRADELAILSQWLISDLCRLVALLGMGGIGKSSLAAKIVDQLKDQFEYVIWRSLRNAPPFGNSII